MAHATREAIEATRDNGGIVSFSNGRVRIEWVDDVPLEAERLIRNADWLIRPSSAREENITLFKRD